MIADLSDGRHVGRRDRRLRVPIDIYKPGLLPCGAGAACNATVRGIIAAQGARRSRAWRRR
jgi:hypothetical protein